MSGAARQLSNFEQMTTLEQEARQRNHSVQAACDLKDRPKAASGACLENVLRTEASRLPIAEENCHDRTHRIQSV
jgi:hypothetical protein